MADAEAGPDRKRFRPAEDPAGGVEPNAELNPAIAADPDVVEASKTRRELTESVSSLNAEIGSLESGRAALEAAVTTARSALDDAEKAVNENTEAASQKKRELEVVSSRMAGAQEKLRVATDAARRRLEEVARPMSAASGTSSSTSAPASALEAAPSPAPESEPAPAVAAPTFDVIYNTLAPVAHKELALTGICTSEGHFLACRNLRPTSVKYFSQVQIESLRKGGFATTDPDAASPPARSPSARPV